MDGLSINLNPPKTLQWVRVGWRVGSLLNPKKQDGRCVLRTFLNPTNRHSWLLLFNVKPYIVCIEEIRALWLTNSRYDHKSLLSCLRWWNFQVPNLSLNLILQSRSSWNRFGYRFFELGFRQNLFFFFLSSDSDIYSRFWGLGIVYWSSVSFSGTLKVELQSDAMARFRNVSKLSCSWLRLHFFQHLWCIYLDSEWVVFMVNMKKKKNKAFVKPVVRKPTVDHVTGDRIPKSFVFSRGKLPGSLRQLQMDLRKLMLPHTALKLKVTYLFI